MNIFPSKLSVVARADAEYAASEEDISPANELDNEPVTASKSADVAPVPPVISIAPLIFNVEPSQ